MTSRPTISDKELDRLARLDEVVTANLIKLTAGTSAIVGVWWSGGWSAVMHVVLAVVLGSMIMMLADQTVGIGSLTRSFVRWSTFSPAQKAEWNRLSGLKRGE